MHAVFYAATYALYRVPSSFLLRYDMISYFAVCSKAILVYRVKPKQKQKKKRKLKTDSSEVPAPSQTVVSCIVCMYALLELLGK